MFRAMTGAACVLLTTVGSGLSADPSGEDVRSARLGEAGELYSRVTEAQKAKKPDEVKKYTDQFVIRLQQAAPHLPLIVTEEAARPKTYQKLTLNAAGTKLDAFRFRVPADGKTWNLNWDFVVPREGSEVNLLAWYIVPREGTMRGFDRFDRADNVVEKGVALPESNRRYVQRLSGGKLRAGGEYVIWFAFKENKPVDVHVRIGLAPFAK